MDAFLTDRGSAEGVSRLEHRWLDGVPFVSTVDEASPGAARDEYRVFATRAGLPPDVIAEMVLVVSELVTNQLRHARFGRIAFRAIEREGVPGVEIIAADRGPGIEDPTSAVLSLRRSSGSLGAGVGSVLKFSHEVDFDVRMGEGTCVWARRFARPVRRRREVAVLGHPISGEPRSGDDATFFRRGDQLYVAIADGLGHGAAAREASSAAIEVMRQPFVDHHDLFARTHGALSRTRGAVMTVVEIDEESLLLSHTAVGNVSAMVVGLDGVRTFVVPALVLGPPRDVVKGRTRTERHVLSSAYDLVLLFSDGLTSKTRLDVRDEIVRAHPLRIAHHVLERFGRDSDDATVVVVA